MKSAGNPVNAYVTIDFMRFLAAFAVLWSHAWGMVVPPFSAGIDAWRPVYWSAGFGANAVCIFFVISGYWITATILRRTQAGTWTWRNYLNDRMSRLYIVLIPALIIGLILDGSGRFLLNLPRYSDFDFMTSENVDIAASLTPQAFFGNLVFLQNIYVPMFGSNGPLWSLTNEFWYYIWFPAILLAFRGKFSVLTALTLVTIILFMNSNVTQGFLIWLLGSLVYVVTERIGASLRKLGPVLRFGAVGAAFLVFLAAIGATRIWPGTWLTDGLIVGGGFSILLATVIALDFGLPKILHPLSIYGARASFSLYLVHFPVLMFLASTVLAGQVFPAGPEAIAAAIGLTLAMVALGWFFSLVTEKHTPAVRKRVAELLSPRKPIPGA
ncbi:MAG TPA: acyltransferase [Hyphomonadaceae bacterium]|nr:acyltransferase [Hyphomonadaceae bacterium]HPI48228.1 acyltransferase [Hyphomonadaceae bacterium]